MKLIWHVAVLRDRFFPYTFMFNPWRRNHARQPKALRLALLPITRLGLICGFSNVDYALVHGPRSRLTVGARCSTTDTMFNVVSGSITVGDDTLFSHGCYVLTGTHRFHGGRRVGLQPELGRAEVPVSGRDIVIGRGCFFGAGAMVVGPVTIGDHVVVGAGAVVTSDVPDQAFVVGVPARVKRRT